MDQPKIPTLKDSQKPQLKIKGLAAGMSLFDRLKQFKKKDLAFILAGLGTLFMAPLAEHFMMAPENGSDTMQAGWGGKGAGGLFNNGGSPYESGITGLAPGGAIGGGGDVITPLNVRDPSALVMGPGGQQQPPAGSLAPQQQPPSSTKEPDLKDALANAAARAAGAVTRRAPMPVPKPGISGSGLRGLGVISGGSSAGSGLGAISSNNLAPRGAAGSNSLGDVRPSSGYRGVAGGRGPGKGGGGSEDLKKAAGSASDLFNQKGAGGALETAAAQQMGGGSAFGGAGGGGSGSNDKGPGGSNTPGSKSVGESLEFLRQKQEMEKALDLKWKMKEKKAMFPIELAQEATKTAVMKGIVEPLSGMMGDALKSSFGPNSQRGVRCADNQFYPGSEVADSFRQCGGGKKYFTCSGAGSTPGTMSLCACGAASAGSPSAPFVHGCTNATVGGAPTPGADTNQNQRNPQSTLPPPDVNAERQNQLTAADGVCGSLDNLGSLEGTGRDQAVVLRRVGARTIKARNNLMGGNMACGSAGVVGTQSASGQLDLARDNAKLVLEALVDNLEKTRTGYAPPDQLELAVKALEEARKRLAAAQEALDSPAGAEVPGKYFGETRTFTDPTAKTWFDTLKTAYTGTTPPGTLNDNISKSRERADRLAAVISELTLAAQGGTPNKPLGVIARIVTVRDVHDKAKPVSEAANSDAAKSLYDGGVKTLIAAAQRDFALAIPTPEPAGGKAVTDMTTPYFTKSTSDGKAKLTALDTALANYAAKAPPAEAKTQVGEINKFAEALKPEAGKILLEIKNSINLSSTGK